MSFAQTVALGALAGFTIYLGLPIGRLQLLDNRMRVAMAMFAVGVLSFIFVDVLSHGLGIVGTALDNARHHHGSAGYVVWLVFLLGAGFAAGSAGLALVERRMRPLGTRRPPIAGGSGAAAFTTTEADALAAELEAARRRALRTGLTIAGAIGVHNFAEGLAIGVSARTGAIGLATVLIVGFALHNATEGFGIVGPLGDVKPSWRWLGLAGLIGGGPTFLGSIVGYGVTSHPLELAFYAAAGGAILYVIGEVWNAMRRYGHRELGLLMLTAGFLVGVITDLVVTLGGG
ncbi:MAG TPA: ZIP family metal transporter [Solirubrobacteraceae bacterium]|nr:ZIP family metal transporter [Solirubrobacteraceae bacterium]